MADKVKDVLVVACPECGEPIGRKCRNYQGIACAPHRRRTALANGRPEREDAQPVEPKSVAPSLFEDCQ